MFCIYLRIKQHWSFSYIAFNDWFADAFANLRKATSRFVMSVCPSIHPSLRLSICPHGTPRLLLYRFLLNLIFEYFSKICRDNPSFILKYRTRIKAHYVKTIIQFWSYLAQFLLDRNCFRQTFLRKSKHILFSITFFENRDLYAIMWTNVERTGHRWRYGACSLYAGYLRLLIHIQVV
jgi:hypothetical protein